MTDDYNYNSYFLCYQHLFSDGQCLSQELTEAHGSSGAFLVCSSTRAELSPGLQDQRMGLEPSPDWVELVADPTLGSLKGVLSVIMGWQSSLVLFWFSCLHFLHSSHPGALSHPRVDCAAATTSEQPQPLGNLVIFGSRMEFGGEKKTCKFNPNTQKRRGGGENPFPPPSLANIPWEGLGVERSGREKVVVK